MITAGTGGNPASASGGRSEVNLENEIILKPSTSYVFEMRNIGTETTDVYYAHSWYEYS